MLQALRDRTNRMVRRTLIRTRDMVDRRLEQLDARKRELQASSTTAAPAGRRRPVRQSARRGRRPRREPPPAPPAPQQE